MSLSVELFDRPEVAAKPGALWTVCSIGEVVTLNLRWRRLMPDGSGQASPDTAEHPKAHLRYSLVHVARATDQELPTTAALKQTNPTDADRGANEVWVGAARIPAPLFWPMTVRVVIDGPGSENRPVAVRLVPRLSVLASGGVVTASLIAMLMFGAFTVSQIKLTPTETLAGVGGVSVVTAVFWLARSIGKSAWPQAMSYLGIPYLLPRALAAVGIGAVLILTLLSKCTVSVHNGTDAKVALMLPARDRPEEIPPGVSLTFARSIDEIERLIQPTGLCAVDVWQAHDEKLGDRASQCEAPAQKLQTRGWERYFAPPKLQLRCQTKKWTGVSYREMVTLDHQPVERHEGSPFEDVRLDVDAKCELKPELSAELRIEVVDPEITSLRGIYEIRYPWHRKYADELAVLGVDGAPDGTSLVVVRGPDAAIQASEHGHLARTQLTAVGNQWLGRGAWIPFGRSTQNIAVSIGGSHTTSSSKLDCTRTQPNEDTHFRAVHVAVAGDRDAIVSLSASSAQVGGWRSVWSGAIGNGAQAWLCPIVAGRDTPVERHFGDFEVDELGIAIKADNLDGGVQLQIPRAWMAEDIVIQAADTRLGTLKCARTGHGEGDGVVTIGAMKMGGRWPADGVGRVKLELAGLTATWTAVDPQGEWAWLCWAGELIDGTLVNVSPSSRAKPYHGKLHPDAGRLDIEARPPDRCWLDLETGKFGEGKPPSDAGGCTTARPHELEQIVSTRKVKCDILELCGDDRNQQGGP